MVVRYNVVKKTFYGSRLVDTEIVACVFTKAEAYRILRDIDSKREPNLSDTVPICITSYTYDIIEL